jgi:hypothetical protein
MDDAMFLRFLTRAAISFAATAFAATTLLAMDVRAEAPAPTVKALKNDKPQRLLFVGNSYLYYGDSLHNHVRRMVIAAGLYKKKQLKYKSATISGSALFDHNIDSYIEPGKLRVKKPFQVVILQGGSAAPWKKGRDVKFRETVAEFSKKIAAAGGETALYLTHAYVKPHKRFDPGMIHAIEKLYVTTGNETGSLVIPVGIAFDEAYRRKPDTKLHKFYDGSHPDLIGTYLAAATVYASLYGQSPVGNPYDYFGKLDKADVTFLQQVAWDTVQKFYGR